MNALPTSLVARCRRALRHGLSGSASGRRSFPPATLEAIQQAIGEGEKQHRAEVRLIVEAALNMGDAFRNVGNRERARSLFAQYGIWDTEENCGVLIYVNLAAREVDIVADRNVGWQVPEQDWQAVCRTMTQGFTQGDFHHSTLAALRQLNAILHKFFPADGARPNQLPDDALIL